MKINRILLGALCSVQSLYSLENHYPVEDFPAHVKILNGVTAHSLGSFCSTWVTFLYRQKLDDSLRTSFAFSVVSCLTAGATALLLEQKIDKFLHHDVVNRKQMLKMRQVLIGVGVGMMTPFATKTFFDNNSPLEAQDLFLPAAGAALVCAGLGAHLILKAKNSDD